MSPSKSLLKPALFALGLVVLVALAGLLAFSPVARADGIVFLTRIGGLISTYPRNNGFSVGTTTPTGAATSTIGKLDVTLNPSDKFLGLQADGWLKAFEVGSTTTAGGTATTTKDIFSIYNTGCIQTVATSSATPVKITFNATTTQGATNNFVLDAAYGTCP